MPRGPRGTVIPRRFDSTNEFDPKMSYPAATVDSVPVTHGVDASSSEGDPEPHQTAGRADAHIEPAAAGFAQRVKALATTAPLHDLDARKGLVGSADYSLYQMSELALHAIDLVTIAMDFDTGARPDDVLRELTPCAAEQAPYRPAAEHAEVAGWVLENLLNVGSSDRGFRVVYGHVGRDGYDRRTFDFKLLEETLGPDGERYLRASNEAVNVLVGALEVDLEAAHIAADVRLDILIKRGRLDEAQAAAQNARYRTIQYGEHLRRQLDATGRDVRTVDWLTAMPAFLQAALDHVTDRYHAENAILINITGVRDTADDPARKVQAARLVEVVKDCLRRNDQLSAGLQAAGRTFRTEQDRQAFTTAPATVSLDLHGQLLRPVLGLPVGDADRALGVFFGAAVGLALPSALRLVDLFDGLITPAAQRDTLGEEVVDPVLSEAEEPDRFSEASYHHLEEVLGLDPDAPQRLSGLLADARACQDEDPDAEDLPLLVAVRVLAQAAEEIASARRHHEPTVLIAVDDGTVLDDPDFAGADLLVCRADLHGEASPEHASGDHDQVPALAPTSSPPPQTGAGVSPPARLDAAARSTTSPAGGAHRSQLVPGTGLVAVGWHSRTDSRPPEDPSEASAETEGAA